MKLIPSIDAKAETIIRDLHRVREAIVEEFGQDLHKLTADARTRQARSGRTVWRGPSAEQIKSLGISSDQTIGKD